MWTKEAEENLARETEDAALYPGMMFRLARERMEGTDLWKIMRKMPKGEWVLELQYYTWLLHRTY